MPRFVISDIHGCRITFEALLDQIGFGSGDQLYLLGDYVDRGPDSKGVIDFIWQLQNQGHQIECLRGNHEELVLRAAGNDFTFLERWLKTDGKDTMDSFGVEACADIPAQYLNWMKALPYYLEIDGYILVHAGLEFSLPNPFSDLREMCWIRNWYHEIDYTWLGERIIIHGHTPIELNRIKYQAQNLDSLKYLDIDAGCVYADALRWTVKDMGNLCAFDLDNRKLYFQPCLEY